MRPLALILLLQLALTVGAADGVPIRTNSSVRVSNSQNDAYTAQVTARIMERSHYKKLPFNDDLSSKFLDRYLMLLDPQRIFFLESDLKEFEPFRLTLDDRTLKTGDTSPANIIFLRFLERYEQQVAYVQELLKQEKFAFTADERYTPNRRTMPRPKDLAEAKKFWRERLRYEYLEAKLNTEKPDVLAKIVVDKVKQQKASEVTKALESKMSKEKAEEFGKLAVEKAGKVKPEEIGKLVLTKLNQDKDDEIIRNLLRRNERVLRMFREFDNDDVFERYLTSFTHVYDPHSDYFGKSSTEQFNISMKLSLFGIGAVLRSEDGYCKIQELMPGPAAKSKKIKPNDRIVAVAQGSHEPVDVVDMKLNKVVEMIRGPKGSEVRLTIIPADAADSSMRVVVSLIRDEIKLEDQEAKAKVIEMPDSAGKTMRMGVIDLPSFYADMESKKEGHKSTTTDVARLLKKLKQEKVSGVILDLRRNGGGSLEEAINLTGLFIKQGPVVQVRDPDGKTEIDSDEDPAMLYDGPLMVLTSRGSASASEIVAAALQDYGRALVVGDISTHGKGTVQSLVQLRPIMQQFGLKLTNDPGSLKLTIRKFYRANGESTQLKGVTPDIVLPSVNNFAEVGEGAMENALEWDTIQSAKFDKVNVVQPYLAELKKRSEKRVNENRDFKYVHEDIERFKKAIAEKSVSMNEAQRLKEKKEALDRVEARKKELKSRGPSAEKVYDLTLKIVDLPGLPAPTVPTNSTHTASAPKSLDDELEDPSVPDVAIASDFTLEEAKRILRDLIVLSGKEIALATK